MNQKSISWIGYMALKLSKPNEYKTQWFHPFKSLSVNITVNIELYKYYKYLNWWLNHQKTPDLSISKVTQNVCHVAPSSHLTSLRAKGYDTHLYTPFTWLHVMRWHTSSTHEDDFHKVFCDHSSNQRKLNIIYQTTFKWRTVCSNTQNPHWNNQGILLET